MEEKTMTISRSTKRRKPAHYNNDGKIFMDNIPVLFKQVVQVIKVIEKRNGKFHTTFRSVTKHVVQ